MITKNKSESGLNESIDIRITLQHFLFNLITVK